MRYQVHIEGTSGLLMHNGAAGLDPYSPAKREIASRAKKSGANRTEADDLRIRELECQVSLWLDEAGLPTIPVGAIRAMIERAARKQKQGGNVREGMIVENLTFEYDQSLGTSVEELGKSVQFTTGVVVQRARVLRTRARFDQWAARFILDCDDELIDQAKIEHWLDIGGRRIGLGDWRPEKSGHFGRFKVTEVKAL